MTQIELGSNTYDVDLESSDSIRDVMQREIRYQYERHNIELPTYNITVHVSNRSLPGNSNATVKSIGYYPSKVYPYSNTIWCFSRSTEKSMKDLIEKFIKKCELTQQHKSETDSNNQDFRYEVSSAFPYAKIEFSDPAKWAGSRVDAKIQIEGGTVTIGKEGKGWTLWLNVEDKNNPEARKQNITNIMNKLLS